MSGRPAVICSRAKETRLLLVRNERYHPSRKSWTVKCSRRDEGVDVVTNLCEDQSLRWVDRETNHLHLSALIDSQQLQTFVQTVLHIWIGFHCFRPPLLRRGIDLLAINR